MIPIKHPLSTNNAGTSNTQKKTGVTTGGVASINLITTKTSPVKLMKPLIQYPSPTHRFEIKL
jgi:hypothetical protein